MFLFRAAIRKHTMVGQKYFGGEQTTVWGAKITKYNKINNNLENFRERASLLPGELRPPGPPLIFGSVSIIVMHIIIQ